MSGNVVLFDAARKGVARTGFRWISVASRSLVVAGALVASAMSAQARDPTANAGISFDIQAQPLADALLAFGATAGVDVYYDGSLAVGRRSAAVKGVYAPMRGLQELLRGTGYVARRAALPDTVTIVAVPPAARSPSGLDVHDGFFALLQARISESLCHNDEQDVDGTQVLFSFWLDPRGVVVRAEVLGSTGSRARRLAIAAAMKGLRIGVPPPPRLPQPVTMAIFPPTAGEQTGCAAATARHEAR